MAAIISENIAQHGIWKALQEMAGVMGRNANRVESMTDDEISTGPVIDAVGIPTYVDDVTQYPDFNLQETGWYIFARIFAKDTVLVTDETTVEGAAYTASAGDDHVCVAVRFDGAAVSQKVTVKWGAYTESFIFKATDLAARNQECRVASKAAEATQGAETATAKAQEASTSATEAGQSATSASESATAAATSASDAAGSATAASQSAEQLSSAVTQVEANTADISNLKQNIKTFVGSPLVASAAAEMTDTTRVYVYVGSETGYTFGNWYYYDGTSWVSGGVYNATAVNTDKTLTQEDQPADAKKTGDEITDLKQDLSYNATNQNAVFESGYYTNNANNMVISRTSETKTRTKITAISGCTYKVTFTSYGTGNLVIIFADEYNNILTSVYGESTRTNVVKYVTAPESTKYLYVTHDVYSQSAVTPIIELMDTTAFVERKTIPSSDLIEYMDASIKRKDAVSVSAIYSAQISASGNIVAQSSTTKKVYIYPVESGQSYILYGEGVYLDNERPIAVFSKSLFDGETSISAEKFLVANTSAVATDYNRLFEPVEDGYVYIATYRSYPQLTLYDAEYTSTVIETLESGIAELNDSVDTLNLLLSHNDTFSIQDLFNGYESAFIDDFTTRTDFIDENHQYTATGDTANQPTILTGTGAIRVGVSGQSSLFYARPINRLPFCAVIGKATGAQQNIRVYGTELFTISGTQGSIVYSGRTVGRLHVNTQYYVVFVTQDRVKVIDDVGVSVTLPIAYTDEKQLTFELGYGTNAGRKFGYSSYVEMTKRTLVDLDFDRCVKENESDESYAQLKSLISFTHSSETGGSTAKYYPAESSDHEVEQSGISNRLCYASIVDYASDTGYRTETKIVSVNSNLTNKNGGLQRFHFDADLRMNSADNPSGAYNTYVFQLHDAGFALTGWVDAPPLAVRVRDGKLYAMINYIDDGAIPESDNRHTTDEYELCSFSYDEWHHIDITARIGWKTGLMPKLTIKVDGIERLNIDTPIGFNIVSSGGYVVTQFGAYCPELKGGTYPDAHREVLYTNINWNGEIEQFS